MTRTAVPRGFCLVACLALAMVARGEEEEEAVRVYRLAKPAGGEPAERRGVGDGAADRHGTG